MESSSCVLTLLEILLLFIPNIPQIVNLDVIACVFHPPRPLDLAINPYDFSTILALLSRRSSYGHQCVCSTNQCSHETVLDVFWLLPEPQITGHTKGVISDARRIGIDIKFTARALGISRDKRMAATTDDSKRCRYGPGCQISRGECCRQSTNVIRAGLFSRADQYLHRRQKRLWT